MDDKKLIYILKRLERSFESVIKLIDKLDTYSLEIKQKVTYKNIKTTFIILFTREWSCRKINC